MRGVSKSKLVWACAAVIAASIALPASADDDVIEFDGKSVRSFHGLTPTGPRRFKTDGEAQIVVDRIVTYVPMRHGVKAFVTDDVTEVPNAEARIDKNGKRVIGFNRAFMQGLKKGVANEWPLVGIAAHEIGHHAGNHNFLPMDNCKLNNEVELEADFYAGFALGKMLVKLDDATSALHQLPKDADCEHPGRLERIAVAKEGWQKATGVTIAGAEKVANLEKAVTFEKAAAASVSRVRAAASIDTGSRFKLRKNRDVHGHDIEKSPGVSFDQCAQKCERNAKCKGFSFDRWNGWCFLKDAMPGSVLDPASVIAVKAGVEFPNVSTVPFEMHRLRRKRFGDKPASTAPAETYELCQKQ
ncbi:MAG: PAN domain-containing protein, partial [Hyphomicrobium sp.]